jgi:methyl-accepting chemotaxis protein
MSEDDRNEKLEGAMKSLRDRTEAHGEPTMSDGSLFFGTTAIPLPDFELVTTTQEEWGCEASILAATDDGFVRVTTTIHRDGERAVGTELEADGPAIGPLKEGKPYRGPANLVGVDYDVYFEPIIDSDDAVIGAFLVAYPLAD